jgi:hypothetical protein
MRKAFACSIGICLILLAGANPAQARSCSEEETNSVRAMLVPITRLSAHQGRNISENKVVIASIRELVKDSPSVRLKKSLKELRALVIKGELNQGSTLYWGYRDGSVWETYKKALSLTQKNTC